MTGSSLNNRWVDNIDWKTILIYLGLVVGGWLTIYSANYTGESASLFDLGQRHGMQLVWIGVSLFIAVVLLLLDDRYYHMLAYPAYGLSVAVLLFTLFFGREVNAAKAWIFIGNTAIQPAEFVKYTTSLALARYMSRDSFDINNLNDLIRVGVLLLIPSAIIVAQNDTGSAVVFASFLLVLYREGLNGWICLAIVMSVVLFVLSLLLTPAAVVFVLAAFCFLLAGALDGEWRRKAVLMSAMALGALTLYFGINLLLGVRISMYPCLLISCGTGAAYALAYAYKNILRNLLYVVLIFVGGCLFSATSDFVFDRMLQTHQQKRIMLLLGIESDPQAWGYNVNQSEIAIGSGGFLGKGFLEGTQTRYDFVPEQGTDFIFSTVGEQWGFVGASATVALFAMLIFRLMRMGDRQRDTFRKVYCYCVAAVFFTHVVINIGMTIGVMPVIGIPLPFFSYGGSSFLAFSLLFFTAVKLDAGKKELLSY